MDEHKVGETGAAGSSETRKQLNAFFDEFCAEALASPQSELFYSQKASQLQDISPECVPALTRRLQKAELAEQDALVQLLAQFKGVEHVSFLQEFVGREAFMPKTGMKILDIFNKSDVIIDSDIAGRLLDYDNLVRKITRALTTEAFDDELIEKFLACSAKQQDGILAQIFEDCGQHSASFLTRLVACDKKAGNRVLDLLEACGDEKGFRIMEAMYAADGRKDILKRMKKVARALGQKGIEVSLPETPAQSGPVFQSAALAPARAFASTIDAEGYRILFLIKPVGTYESKIFNIITNDSTGIRALDVFASYRGETSQLIKKLQGDKKSDFREIDTACCVSLVMEAVTISRAKDRIVPATIAQFEALFADDISKKAGPAIYSIFSADEIAALDPVPDTAGLVGTMELAFWYISTGEGKACWEKFARLDADSKTGTGEDRQKQICTWAAEELTAFFTAERKHAFKRRLEEFSAILHSKGYSDQARTALFAALQLAAPEHDPQQDPFCKKIIDRAFEIFYQTLEANTQGTGTGAAAEKVV